MQTYLNICVILIIFLKTLNAHPKGKNIIRDDQTPDESDWSKRSDNSKIIHAVFPEIPKKGKQQLSFEGDFIRIDGNIFPAEDFLETFSEDGEERLKIKWDKYDEEIASVNNQEHGRSILSINYMRFAELCFPVSSERDDDQMENEKSFDERKVHRNYIEIDRKMYQCEDFYASLWEDNDEHDDYSKIAQIGNSSNEITANNEEEPDEHSKRSETSMIVRQVFPKIPKKAKKLGFEDKNIRIDGKLYPSEKFLESLANSRASTINCKSPDYDEDAGEENVALPTTKNSCKQIAKAIWRCVRKGARVIRRACTALSCSSLRA